MGIAIFLLLICLAVVVAGVSMIVSRHRILENMRATPSVGIRTVRGVVGLGVLTTAAGCLGAALVLSRLVVPVL